MSEAWLLFFFFVSFSHIFDVFCPSLIFDRSSSLFLVPLSLTPRCLTSSISLSLSLFLFKMTSSSCRASSLGSGIPISFSLTSRLVAVTPLPTILSTPCSTCHKLHLAISPSILHRFSRSQWLRKALEKTFRSVPVTSRGDQ